VRPLQLRVIRQFDDRSREVSIVNYPTAMALAGLVLDKDQLPCRDLAALTVAHFNAELTG